MRHRKVAGDALESKSDGLAIGSVRKVESRKASRVKRSTWQVEWQYLAESKPFVSAFWVESSRVPGESRGQRYPHREGGTAIVKDMRAVQLERGGARLPGLVLKSFKTNYWPRKLDAGLDLPTLRHASHYLRAQGFCSYVGLHPPADKHEGKQKPFVVMQRIGDGQNLYQLTQNKRKNFGLLITPKAREIFAQAICRLLAFIDFFHRNEDRPILDIKAENFIPILDTYDRIERLAVIDLDGSLGGSLVFTPSAMTRADFKRAYRSDPQRLDRTIDFRTLANVLAEVVNEIEPNKYFSVVSSAYSRKLKFPVMECKVLKCAPRSPLLDLFTALSRARDGMTGREVIGRAFSPFESALYLKFYGAEMQDLQRRYDFAAKSSAEPVPESPTARPTGLADGAALFTKPKARKLELKQAAAKVASKAGGCTTM
ncbi:MAG: hypothetical protein P1U63_09135 [Coxiellaceae bacterium]|nr:hypothetical protein [Coxiellaceae bacterium]